MLFWKKRADPGEILIGHTKRGGKVTVCIQCKNYGYVPHFNYYYRRKRVLPLLIEAAEAMDHMGNLELKYRYDLEEFLCSLAPEREGTYWDLVVNAWNAHNKVQVIPHLHKPYYIDLKGFENHSLVTGRHRKIPGPKRCKVWIGTTDPEGTPHFHFVRENGDNIAISMKGPFYMEPALHKLSRAELVDLLAFLEQEDGTPFQDMVLLWNDQNQDSPGAERLPENCPMPDYRTLETEDDGNV